MKECEDIEIPYKSKHNIIKALLLTSKSKNKDQLLYNAFDIALTTTTTLPYYLLLDLTYQLSVLLRLSGDYSNSKKLILNCKLPSIYPTDRRFHASYGRLYNSYLENLIQEENYDAATHEIANWSPLNPSSMIELDVLARKQMTSAKLLRCQGRFDDARQLLEGCPILPYHLHRYSLRASLADAYTDLGSPCKALEILTQEITDAKTNEVKNKAYRRLFVSSITANIEYGQYKEAERCLKDTLPLFQIKDPNVSDQLLHIRFLISSAQILHHNLHWLEALAEWEAILSYIRIYKSFEGEGYVYAVSHLSISVVQLYLGNIDEAWKAFDHAAKVLRTGIRDFWIPSLPRWHASLVTNIQSITGWTI